jgi:hypothetical protein
MRASYRHGVSWIALNDEPILDADQITGLISIGLLADLFGKDPETVAADVIRYRIRYAEQHS